MQECYARANRRGIQNKGTLVREWPGNWSGSACCGSARGAQTVPHEDWWLHIKGFWLGGLHREVMKGRTRAGMEEQSAQKAVASAGDVIIIVPSQRTSLIWNSYFCPRAEARVEDRILEDDDRDLNECT